MPTLASDGEKTAPPNRKGAARPNSVTVGDLMGNARELIILHAEEQYRLRITSNGKLILTK